MIRRNLATTLFAAAAMTSSMARADGPGGASSVGALERGPTAELYLRRRPTSPVAPVLAPELKELLGTTEKKRDDKRIAAIELLRQFLGSKPSGEAHAEGLFKLAELLWEEARRQYLIAMDGWDRALEACHDAPGGCTTPPPEPRIALGESEALYKQLLAEHPDFRRTDLVLYLVGFAAKEDQREDEALARFHDVIAKFPQSPLTGDAWMMIGEHHFGRSQWADARTAYANILVDPNAPTYDLAMFKTAWCDWKLGDPEGAAKKFKTVLDLATAAETSGSASLRRRRASLRDEALEYLVVVFTEDKSIAAKDVFDFLASIGGERYSRDVLIKVAESYVGQSEYERANDTYEFLIKMDPSALKTAEWQRAIVQNWQSALDFEHSQTAMKVLVDTYGPASPWLHGQHNQEAALRSLSATEDLVRTTATNLHAEAQAQEKSATKATAKGKKAKAPDLTLYNRAVAAYGVYLDAFWSAGTATPTTVALPDLHDHVIEARFLRAEILLFKLDKLEAAGDEYMAVGSTTPVGKRHKDALLKAMNAFEKARPADTNGKRQLVAVDKKFASAIDLYATLFPADPELVDVIFRNGQLFFDYGDYDEAIKRFGVIVTKYPTHPDAGPAGDRILAALGKAQDFENIETWARRLKTAPSFAAADQQARLDKLIVESIQKTAEKLAAADKFQQAGEAYLRIPKEFPAHALAATSLSNAGVMFEKAKLPERAAETYLSIAEKYPNAPEAEKSAFAAGQVYERVAYFDKAAAAYELVAEKLDPTGKSAHGADALFNAGLLRQALGQNDKAIAHYQVYAQRYHTRKDAPDVAFNIGVVYEAAKDDSNASKAFGDFIKSYRDSKRLAEAHVRLGRTLFRQSQWARAQTEFAEAIALAKKTAPHGKNAKADSNPWPAEARYWQGELMFRDYQQVTLAVAPKELQHALKKKSELLGKAQAVYLSVVDYNDLHWATAALFRVGQIYDGFATELGNAPTPQGLSTADAQAYRDALDMYVVQIQDKANELFSTGYSKAIQMQVYDQYTAKIREALGRLAADKYPPERESRTGQRIGDRPLPTEVVKEVAR